MRGCTCRGLGGVLCPQCERLLAFAVQKGIVAAPKASAVTEKAFMGAIIAIARKAGFLVYHTYNAKRSPEGFMDLVMAHPTRLELPVFCIECKTATGQVTPAQQAWVDALDGRTTVSAIWRPHDLPMVTRWLRGEGGATTIDR